MSKEMAFLRCIQAVIFFNTFVFIYSASKAIKGQIALHRKINLLAFTVTLIGVLGLVVTVILGWDYSLLTSPLRMRIHRAFSTPLLFSLILTAYFGLRQNKRWHLFWAKITVPFWMGTLITGIWFFS